MNKVLQINLGGFPITIDEDAFEALNKYLQSLKTHFSKSESKDEIIADIEGRLAELLSEQLGGRAIVGKNDVEAAIKIMGTPEDFGVETEAEPTANQQESKSETYQTGKKLFRDTQNKIVGGVCSGIAAYFGIEDPLWVRIAFVAGGFVFGFGFPLYIILMLFIPKADSAADRLAMKGKPINVANIADIIENEIERISNKISGLESNDPASAGKMGSRSERKEKAQHILEEGVSIIGTAFNYALKFFGKIFQSVGFVAGILLMIFALILWVALFIGFFKFFTFWVAILGSKILSFLALISIFFFVTVPLASLVLFLLRVFKRVKINPTLRYGIWGGYGVNIALMFLIGSILGNNMSKEANITKSYNTAGIKSDTLVVDLNDNTTSSFNNEIFGFVKDDKTASFISNDVNIRIIESDKENFEIIQSNNAKGKAESEAETRASLISNQSQLTSNRFLVNNIFSIPNTEKIRNQHVNYTIKVPVGKYIKISSDVARLIYDFPYCDDEEAPEGYDHTWKMTENGLICPKFIAENKVERKSISVGTFKKLQIEGNFIVTVIKNNDPRLNSFSISGKTDIYNQVQRSQPNDYLQLTLNEETDEPLELHVSACELESIDLENVKECKILGFNQKSMKITTVGDFEIEMTGDVEDLSMNIEQSTVSLKGKGNNLNLDIDNGIIKANGYELKTAEINDRNSEGSIYVSDKVTINGDEDAYKIKGGASVKNVKNKNDEE